MRRLFSRGLCPVVLVFFAFAPAASAWTWPVRGPVLESFAFDHAHPYAAGQHRGITIGADAGDTVLAPVAGVVSFAGTVPDSGKSLTIKTADGLAVTVTHLGSLAVARDATIGEGDPVGAVGVDASVHLGVREAADEQGYLDPLRFLPTPGSGSPAPPVPVPVAAAAPAPVAAPVPAAAAVAAPAPAPVPAVAPTAPAPAPAGEAAAAQPVDAARPATTPARSVTPGTDPRPGLSVAAASATAAAAPVRPAPPRTGAAASSVQARGHAAVRTGPAGRRAGRGAPVAASPAAHNPPATLRHAAAARPPRTASSPAPARASDAAVGAAAHRPVTASPVRARSAVRTLVGAAAMVAAFVLVVVLLARLPATRVAVARIRRRGDLLT